MDFEAIHKLQEEEQQNNVAPQPAQGADDGLPQEYHASEEALNIAMNQLNLIVKNFKNDNYVQTLMNFYDGKSVNESVDSVNDAKHLTEAKKGSFKAYYKQLTKATSNMAKKVKIVGLIVIAAAIVAGVGGTVLFNKLKEGKKALKDAKALEKGKDESGLVTPGTEQATQQAAEKALADGKDVEPTDPNAQKTPEEKKAELKPADPTVVAAVEAGQYGVNPDRVNNLIKAGYDPTSVQNAVNQDIKSHPEKQTTAPQAVETPASEQEVVAKIAKKEAEPGSTAPATEFANPNVTDTNKQGDQTRGQQFDNAGHGGKDPAVTDDNKDQLTDATVKDLHNSQPDNGYSQWRNNPKNQKFINSMEAQAQAAGKDPEKVLKHIYAKGGGKDVNALRTIEKDYGFSDISGSGTTDKKVMKTINQSTAMAKAKENPRVQSYINLLRQHYPKKFGNQSFEQIADQVSWAHSWLSEPKRVERDRGGFTTEWVEIPGVTPQIKQGYNILKAAKSGKSN